MTPARRLATTRAALDQPPAEPLPGQLALDHHLAYEEWPDGTFGGTRPNRGWTPEQQAAHRADLEAALHRPRRLGATVTRPRLLDLCCCAGGAAMGYHRAGFDITGVDIAPRPRYPFTFIQADAVDYVLAHGHEYDAIHGSWPCQFDAAITKGTNAHLRDTYADLYEPGRAAMLATGRPWVIETTAARPDVVLCGTQFELPILRHRKFEVHGWTPLAPPHMRHRGRVRGWRHGQYHEGDYLAVYGKGGGKATIPEMQAALGIDWTDVHEELTEAIPPAYTQFLGEQLIAQLAVTAA